MQREHAAPDGPARLEQVGAHRGLLHPQLASDIGRFAPAKVDKLEDLPLSRGEPFVALYDERGDHTLVMSELRLGNDVDGQFAQTSRLASALASIMLSRRIAGNREKPRREAALPLKPVNPPFEPNQYVLRDVVRDIGITRESCRPTMYATLHASDEQPESVTFSGAYLLEEQGELGLVGHGLVGEHSQ